MHHRSLLIVFGLTMALLPLLLMLGSVLVFGSLHVAIRTVRHIHVRPRLRRRPPDAV